MDGNNGNGRMLGNMMGWWRKGVRKLGLMIELEREGERVGIQDMNE